MRRHILHLWTDQGKKEVFVEWKVDELDSGETHILSEGVLAPGVSLHALRRVLQALITAEVVGLDAARRHVEGWRKEDSWREVPLF